MYSACGNAVLPALGFPIRESADQWLFSAYPRLIAAVHALHRLLVPRHPPCALPILTVITRTASAAEHAVIPVCWHGCAVFKVRVEAHARAGRSVSQNSTACGPESRPTNRSGDVRRLSRWTSSRAARSGRHSGAAPVERAGAVCAGLRSDRSNPGASLERR